MAVQHAGQVQELPPKYYLDNFRSLLTFVQEKYQPVMGFAELAFINAFNSLSEDAQCLYLRFANRKGTFFRPTKLSYTEIGCLNTSLEELLNRGFCRSIQANHLHLLPELIYVLNKAELSKINKQFSPGVKGISKLKKDELAEAMLRELPESDLLQGILALDDFVFQYYTDEYEMLKFLFFGHLDGQMSDFVVRDLGLVRFEQPQEDKLVAKFNNWQEAQDQFWVSSMYKKFRHLREAASSEHLYSWFMQIASRGKQLYTPARQTYDRLTRKLGRMLERQQQPDFALEVYRFTITPPSRERQARILQKRGETQQAVSLCREILNAPESSEEAIFAQDFLLKQEDKKATRSTTRWLKDSDTITISEEYKYYVEKGVLRYYADKGYNAMYSENYLFRSLFGLVFWDIIFDQDAQVYHSPLQRFPSDLYLPQFLLKRQDKMQLRLKELGNRRKLKKHITAFYDEKWGLGNPLVGWHENTLPLVSAACKSIPLEGLYATLMEMAKNLKEYGRGFPDIFIWKKNTYKLIEVKSPTDALSPQQLYWLQFFKSNGVDAEVQRVQWK